MTLQDQADTVSVTSSHRSKMSIGNVAKLRGGMKGNIRMNSIVSKKSSISSKDTAANSVAEECSRVLVNGTAAATWIATPLHCTLRMDGSGTSAALLQTLLKHIAYCNTSDNPRDLYKVLRMVAHDAGPHPSVCLFEITVKPVDHITELQRIRNEPKTFRTHSAADVDGFCLFDDVQLYDPDTFCFNGGYIVVELVGGGDPKGDQLGVLSPALQQRHTDASNSSAPGGAGTEGTNGDPYRDATVEVRGENVVLGGSIIGRLVLDAPTPEGNSNLRVTFCDPPEGASRVRSHEDARALKGAVTIGMLERVLHVITYTNIAPKVKPGTRIYQARVGFDDAEGKLRLALNVAGPLLWNPDYGSEISFREGSAPVLVLPKVSVNLGEQDVLRDGSVEIRITEGCETQ